MQMKIDKLAEENLNLEGNFNLMNIEIGIAESKFISQVENNRRISMIIPKIESTTFIGKPTS